MIAPASLILAGLLAAGPEGPGAQRARYEAPPETRARFDALRRAAQVPVRSADDLVPADGAVVRVRAELAEVVDGTLLLRQPLTPGQELALGRHGIPEVSTRAEVRAQVRFEHALYVGYLAAPGVDLEPLSVHRGHPIQLELVRTGNGHWWVTRATPDR